MFFMKKVRYLIEFFFAYLLIKFLQIFPISTSSNILGFLAKYILLLAGVFTGDNKKGIRQIGFVFPEITEKERWKILIKSYQNIGRFIAEYINQHKMTEKWFKKNVEVVNGEYFLEMVSKGSFPMTAHFGNWEVMQRFLTLNGKDLSVIYNPIQNPYINKLYLKQRSVSQLPKGTNAMKQLIELIKEKKSIGVVADQRDKAGEVYQFFGKDAKTSTAIQRLSVKYNYPIFCVKCERKLENPNKFTLTVYSALKTTKESQAEAIQDLTEQSLKFMESWIVKSPENWLLWFYSRWRVYF